MRLVNAIAETYSIFMNKKIDPLSDVLITVGADGSLFNAFSSFMNEGDEVNVIKTNCKKHKKK